jgi:hypothetical protein
MRLYFIEQLKSRRRLTYELFLRLMGLVYFFAFFSVVSQVNGLYGDHGILPVTKYLNDVRESNGALSCLVCPTLLWLAPSAHGLSLCAISGSVIALLLVSGFLPQVCTVLLYILYLSIVSVGQEFLSYQWDMLLLQTGFLAIIVSLVNAHPPLSASPKRLLPLVTFFLFWLNFRLIFSSGLCKIASGDPTWADLSALTYHFFTQPLPTPLAIFANATNPGLSKLVCFFTLFFEIVVPFFVFAARPLRIVAIALLALLQMAIILTGNYCFFNLLALVLLVPLADDALLLRLIKAFRRLKVPGARAMARAAFRNPREPYVAGRDEGRIGQKLSRFIALPLVAIVGLNFVLDLGGRIAYSFCPGPLMFVHSLSQTFGIDSNYGLFAVMTRERPEILVEGSDDGFTFKLYQFKYKISRADQAPPIVAPMQPRLDWQMWFEGLNATYGDPYDPDKGLNPAISVWFVKFLERLSVGDKDVLSLIAVNPFPQKPPKIIRARVVNFYFVSPIELLQTGKWWKTREIGTYADSRWHIFETKYLQP